jgi:spore coat polysaccharide biosynthesis protein SpsF (cytidylyltransferase family)
MKRDSEKKKKELPLSQRYKDIIKRNPQLFRDLAERKKQWTAEDLLAVVDTAPDLARALHLEDINEIGKSQ